jgi:ABC-type sugar transport system substrate-binding protein
VFVFGTDMSEQIGGFLTSPENVLQAVTGQKPFDIGQQALNAAVAALHKQSVDKKVLLPGVLFHRDKPDEIRSYVAFLQSVSK